MCLPLLFLHAVAGLHIECSVLLYHLEHLKPNNTSQHTRAITHPSPPANKPGTSDIQHHQSTNQEHHTFSTTGQTRDIRHPAKPVSKPGTSDIQQHQSTNWEHWTSNNTSQQPRNITHLAPLVNQGHRTTNNTSQQTRDI